jgi:hypothetical protein
LDVVLAKLAHRQHAVVTLAQLARLGLSRSGVQSRVARGRLHRVHRGVYAVGHSLLSVEGRYMAAVLACGTGAALSHRSSGDHVGIRPTSRARIDVTVPGQRGRRRKGLDVHRSSLAAEDITPVNGIPCTTVARTLIDLAEVIDQRQIELAIDRAEQRRIFDRAALERALARADGRAGASVLRRLMAPADWRPRLTREELEECFLCICRNAGIPEPEVNAWIPFENGIGAEADFLWRERRLVIETDGRETHGTRQAFESDRLRDQRLAVLGFRVVRFTWRQVEDDPAWVVATLRKLVV